MAGLKFSNMIDQRAVCSLLNARKSADDGGGPLLDTTDKRVLKRIISGSVRAPDRLAAAKLIDSDVCSCGQRATTEHIFWECPRYTEVRARSLHEISTYIEKVRESS